MKKLFTFILLLSALSVLGQTQVPAGQQPSPLTPLSTNTSYLDPNTGSHWFFNGTFGWWNAGFTINGGAITTMPSIGFNPGTQLSASQWIVNAFYGSQPPTAGLTGGVIYELRSSNPTTTLNWQYGRQSATATVSSAVINPSSLNIFGSQPTQPGSITGTQAVTTTANTNTTYTLTVTTSDGKTATSTTNVTFLPRFFYGRCTGTSPTGVEVLAFAGGSNPLSGTHAVGPVTITASGSNYFFFSYPASLGTVTLIKDVNGFDVTTSFNLTTLSFTNSQGYSYTANVYTHNAATSGNYIITTN